MKENLAIPINNENFWFPGRWISGITMILGPLLLLIGVVLRSKYHFFFPDQLVAYKNHPTLIFFSYSFFIGGNILMWPAVSSLSRMIGVKKPGWALWGGTFAMFGLFARTFHAGVDHLAFQMVRIQGVDTATKIIQDSYSAYHIFHTLAPLIMFGWIILAIGGYISKTLGLFRSISLTLMSGLPLGVLKGTTTFSIIAVLGLCITFIPLGLNLINQKPKPTLKQVLGWTFGMVVLIAFLSLIRISLKCSLIRRIS
jgi:hypothetical protein